MNILFHKHFKKQYKKLRALQQIIDARLVLFSENPTNPLLNNHALSGNYTGYRSINISGDYRAIYELIENNTAYFITIDNHNNLYT